MRKENVNLGDSGRVIRARPGQALCQPSEGVFIGAHTEAALPSDVPGEQEGRLAGYPKRAGVGIRRKEDMIGIP
jgi:hypothetical protein